MPGKLADTCFLLRESTIRYAWVRPHRTTKRFSLRDMVNAMPRFFAVFHLQKMGRFLVHGELEFTRF